MKFKQITLRVGEKMPEEMFGNIHTSKFGCAWHNDTINIMVMDCQNDKEAEIFKKSRINFSVCRVQDIIFFVIKIKELGIEFDVPYNVNLTPLTLEDIEKGVNRIALYFLDDKGIIKGIRAMELVPGTIKKLADIFITEKEDLIIIEKEYHETIDRIYKRYPSPSDLLQREILNIKWRMDIQ